MPPNSAVGVDSTELALPRPLKPSFFGNGRRRSGRLSKSRKKALFFSLSRWLHVYTSAALFGLLVFFCITGILLNRGWYGAKGETTFEELPMVAELRGPVGSSIPDGEALSSWIEGRYGWSSPSSIDMDLDIGEVIVAYDMPAGFASVTFDFSADAVIVERHQGSVLAILNDLHKGRHSGHVWAWVIDLSAVAMLVFAVTGIILLLQNRRIRKTGLWATALGVLTPIALYLLFVPSSSP